ncbi:hypothetical protein [Polluticoccus soli]|uniref:hypothetical protein n=1 Tax=Polluticoccus soli TaxID=3034150 RepID=UPI0023E163CF|nr:hypothetical protein [Flavipsychrobacter sp. JY13-12]
MNRLISTLAALFFCAYCSGQEYYGTWDIRDSTEHYVFAETAYIRADTSLNSAILDSLQVGDNVLVLHTTSAVATVRGITAPWVKLSYNRNGSEKTGYMWRTLLSFGRLRRGDTKFIYGLERKLSKDTASEYGNYTMRWYDAKLKVVINSSKVAESAFRVDAGEGGDYVSTAISDGKRLENVKQIPAISIGGGACGVGTHTFMHTWNGKELYALPKLYEVGDAGVYYYTEQFTFPADKGGKPGIVTWTSEEAEATEKLKKNGEPVFKTTKKKKSYAWDGKKLSPR